MLAAARFASTAARAVPVRTFSKIGVTGLGSMGHGIVQTAAQSGYDVVAVDMNQQAVDHGLDSVAKSVDKIFSKKAAKEGSDPEDAKKKAQETMARIQSSTSIDALADCDLIIEAIVENTDIKRQFYGDLSKVCADNKSAVFASNTSSLPISVMADASDRPDRVIGLHFFNPVQLMKLVEVVRTDNTSQAVFDEAFAFCQGLGKTPIACKDTPGFVVNRLLVPYLAQALSMLDRGDASPEDIDTGMRLGAGHPMGPITLADYVGLDVCLFILEGWIKDYPNDTSFFVPEVLRKKVAEGKLGRKSGEGFYKWEGDRRA